jgi:hypothetical protein
MNSAGNRPPDDITPADNCSSSEPPTAHSATFSFRASHSHAPDISRGAVGAEGPPIRVSGFCGRIWCRNAQGVTSYPPAARNIVRPGPVDQIGIETTHRILFAQRLNGNRPKMEDLFAP